MSYCKRDMTQKKYNTGCNSSACALELHLELYFFCNSFIGDEIDDDKYRAVQTNRGVMSQTYVVRKEEMCF